MRRVVRQATEAHRERKLFSLVKDDLEELEHFLLQEVQLARGLVREVASWVLGAGGKRVRPGLLLVVAKMLGCDKLTAIRYAAAIELIHTATLVHDDVLDGSETRRGRITAHKRWGSQAAVLAGDWMYTRSMQICLEDGHLEVMRLLTSTTAQMIEGELLSDSSRGNLNLDENTYFEITRCKTAELFAASCAIPALLAGADESTRERLASFGRNLGLCFQLVDDLLDYFGSEDELGKPVFSDIREGKVTLPLILLLKHGDGKARELASEMLGRDLEPEAGMKLRRLMVELGVYQEVKSRAESYARTAENLLDPFSAYPEAALLREAARLLVARTS